MKTDKNILYLQGHKWKITNRFNSKKNEVYMIKSANNKYNEQPRIHDQPASEASKRGQFILKIYNKNMKKELALLALLKNKSLNVPEVYYSGDNYLIMDYIPGPTLLEYMLEREKKNIPVQDLNSLFNKFTAWLDSFYRIVRKNDSLIKGDINFRNFIISASKMYGVDFEDCRPGIIEEDAGKMLAFALTYHPLFTGWRQEFTLSLYHHIVSTLALNKKEVGAHYRQELDAIEERREIGKIPDYIRDLI